MRSVFALVKEKLTEFLVGVRRQFLRFPLASLRHATDTNIDELTVSATAVRTIFDMLPIARPFFAPTEGQVALDADLGRQIPLFDHLGHETSFSAPCAWRKRRTHPGAIGLRRQVPSVWYPSGGQRVVQLR